MHHLATVSESGFEHLPFRVQCSCGTGGSFGGKLEAMEWMVAKHFNSLGGINTAELQDNAPQALEPALVPEPAPAPEPAPEQEQPDAPAKVPENPDDPSGGGAVHDVPAVPAENPD